MGIRSFAHLKNKRKSAGQKQPAAVTKKAANVMQEPPTEKQQKTDSIIQSRYCMAVGCPRSSVDGIGSDAESWFCLRWHDAGTEKEMAEFRRIKQDVKISQCPKFEEYNKK